jgi:hypothetical protein
VVREGQERGEIPRKHPAEQLAAVLTVGFMAPLILPASEERNRAFLSLLD